jgi:hypothetical protein
MKVGSGAARPRVRLTLPINQGFRTDPFDPFEDLPVGFDHPA